MTWCLLMDRHFCLGSECCICSSSSTWPGLEYANCIQFSTDGWRKSLTAITQECCEQYWTCPGNNTPQSSSYMATSYPLRKLSKLDEPDMRDTAGEEGTISWVMYSCGPLHMDEQRQDIQFEPTCSSSVPIRDVFPRICRKQWTIGRCGERRSGISVLIALHDDDDDDDAFHSNR